MYSDKKNVHGIKLNTVNKWIIVLTALFAAALFYATLTTTTYYNAMNDLNLEYRYLRQQADILQEASDYLTNQVHEFVVTADLADLEAYFHEVHVDRRREKALNELSLHQDINYDDVKAAADESNALMQQEIYAMKLVISAHGYDESTLPQEIREMSLEEADAALSAEDKIEKARTLIHDADYHQAKDEIHSNLVDFAEKALLNIDGRIAAGSVSFQRSLETARVLLVLLVCFNILVVFVLSYLVLRPLNTFLDNIRSKTALDEVGSYEFKHLAQVYNKISSEKNIYQFKAERDRLTGLYSRETFFEKAEEMIASEEGELYIVRINVCRFKLVNELQGVEKGDRLLKSIAATLSELSAEHGFLASRFSADRFYLCVRKEDFERIEMVKRFTVPWLTMDVSITYGVCRADRETPVILLCDRANMAISSNSHKVFESIYYYDNRFHEQLLQEQEIENEMERALAERHFCIYIQPKIDVESECVVGGEVLVRWIHPEKGMISPGVFISVFEKNGFILSLDYYVWEESCRFLAQCQEKGLPIKPLSINVSRLHFYSGELQGKLLELVEKYRLDPSDLELEITESIYADEPEIILEQCGALQALGFKIAMDDFGSGYSSLNMLKKMPLDIIKMDLRFLSDDGNAEEAAKGQDILRTQIELAHTLEINVVVEGLETEEQKDFIKTVGNCVAQGYYYSRPVEPQRYLELASQKV